MSRSSSISSRELARQHELNKYYQPWLDFRKLKAVPVESESDDNQAERHSHDATLTALAQLAALRLNVKRAMVSLIDTDAQIILAEATQTLSLGRHTADDQMWPGNVSIPRRNCIDEHALRATTTCRDSSGRHIELSALVVEDCLDDDRFKSRSYVRSGPNIRFYAGVPIVTEHGHAIGVYAVSDTRPRPGGLTFDQLQFMTDVAKIVTEHLDRVSK